MCVVSQFLCTSFSNKFFQERIKDESPAARATVISAIRYTFAESTRSYDDLLGSVIIDFLSLITDPDLVRFQVREETRLLTTFV